MRNCGEYEERDKMEKKDHPPKAKAFRRAGKDKKEKGKTQKEQREEGNTGEGKVSVIVTVKDDPEGERKLMEALAGQTVRPDEVIIVEAGECGRRFKESPCHAARKHLKPPIFARRILSVGCSRGKGRNIGVRMARNEVIAVTDAGCRPRKDWLEKMIANDANGLKRMNANKRMEKKPIVVAGGYRAEAKTELQRVMAGFLSPIAKIAKNTEIHEPECSNRETPWHTPRSHPIFAGEYLPASRSIMFTKKAWEAVGGYPEEAVSGAEDLEFARRLAAHPEVKMIYCPQAVVDWEGPARLGEFFRDIVKHTRGNVEVGYWPHLIKNFTVVLRWMVFLAFPWMIPIYLAVSWLYKGQAFGYKGLAFSIWFPIVQLAADFGVIWGLTLGILGRLGKLGKLGNIIHR